MPRIAERLTTKTIGAYSGRSLSSRFRQSRWATFAATFPLLNEMHVLDVGGDVRAWRLSGLRPAHLTLLNLPDGEGGQLWKSDLEPWMSIFTADACELPDDAPTADLVYSNSVIEHVGGHWRRQRFAEGVRSLADRYWVQTPYRYFPIEPHFLIPALAQLPRTVQAEIVKAWPVGHYAIVKDRETAIKRLMDIELLSASDLRAYFPDSHIARERVAGMTKSLIAIKAQ
jgi:hypothetical protein